MLFGAELSDKILEFSVSKLCLVVSGKCLRYAEPGEYISFIEMKNVVRRDFGEGFGLYPFGEVVHDDDQEFVLV